MGNLRHLWRWLAVISTLLALCLGAAAVVALTSTPSDVDAPAADSADAGFARDMAVHHQQAVDMSFVVRERTDDEEVRRLAFDIINTQANQRGMLLGRLDAWGLPATSQQPPMAWMNHDMDYKPHDGSLMPGMATNTKLDRLRRAEGQAAEALYLRLMTAHHRSGVDMARRAVELAEDETMVKLAKSMVRGQQSEMQLMAGMLKDRGARAER